MSKRIPVRVIEFVHMTDLIPKQWDSWFFEMMATNAPFSWGDNNRSLITAERFADHAEDCFSAGEETSEDTGEEEYPPVGARREWLKKIRRLGQMYVDLES